MKKIFFIFFLLQMTASVKSQSFEYIYSTTDDETINDVVQDSTGNYYMAGFKGTFTGVIISTTYSSLIIKLSPSGDTLKTLVIPPPVNGIAQLFHVLKITDTTFAAFGVKNFLQGVSKDQIWYLKFDKDLNILKDKVMGDTAYYQGPNSACIGFSNEILVAGTAISTNGSFNWQAILYRLSLEGDSLQSFYLGDSTSVQMGLEVLELPDTSGYLLFGTGFIQPSTGHEILRLDTGGVIDTIYTMPSVPGDHAITAKWLTDSIFVTATAGHDPLIFPMEDHLCFNRYDLNFNLLTDTFMGPPDTVETEAIRSLDFIDPDNIYGGGTINLYGLLFDPDTSFYYVIKFDSSLTPQWEKIISHNYDRLQLFSVRATNDGGVLLAGTRYNYQTSGLNERDIYVIKLDSLGNFTTGINNPTVTTAVHDVIVYPNHVQDIIHINSTINFKATDFRLFDSSGREVMHKKFSKAASFSVKELRTGIYFYEIKGEKGKMERGKVVKGN